MKNIHDFDIFDVDIENIEWIYRMHKQAPWEFNTKNHPVNFANTNRYELLFITSGSYLKQYEDGYKQLSKKGSLTINSRSYAVPYINTSVELPLQYYSITFDTKKPLDGTFLDRHRCSLFPKHPDKVESLFYKAFNSFITKPFTWKIDIKAYTLRILSVFFKEYFIEDTYQSMPGVIQMAYQKLEHDIFLENINITELAKEANLSVDYFIRLFKKTFGETPKKYILKRKLEHAALLLSSSDRTVSEIAEASGFSNASYFTVAFKEHFKMSPGSYRKHMGILEP